LEDALTISELTRSLALPRAATVLLGTLLLAGCGSGSGGTPTPLPSPSATPGPVSGAYTLQLVPAPSCGFPAGTLSFPMVVASAPGARYPGLQVVLAGDSSALEAELLNNPGMVRGGLGTRADGVLASEGRRVWVRAIADAAITRASDGRGEVASGILLGYLALGEADGDEGSLGSCTSTNHTFSLRAR
jgi:hypothetical protein